jgi:hypothetical protein
MLLFLLLWTATGAPRLWLRLGLIVGPWPSVLKYSKWTVRKESTIIIVVVSTNLEKPRIHRYLTSALLILWPRDCWRLGCVAYASFKITETGHLSVQLKRNLLENLISCHPCSTIYATKVELRWEGTCLKVLVLSGHRRAFCKLDKWNITYLQNLELCKFHQKLCRTSNFIFTIQFDLLLRIERPKVYSWIPTVI